MKGQTRALIPGLIGIAPLLLAGIMGYLQNPGADEATTVAATRALTPAAQHRLVLDTAMQDGAKEAANAMSITVASDLSRQLKRKQPAVLALATVAGEDRG